MYFLVFEGFPVSTTSGRKEALESETIWMRILAHLYRHDEQEADIFDPEGHRENRSRLVCPDQLLPR